MKPNELSKNEYSSFNATYIGAAGTDDLIKGLENGSNQMVSFIFSVPVGKLEYRYLDGKWTIKDIIQHIIDAERIFSYRALRISRNDKTPLAGFEENCYVDNTNANTRDIEDLLTELVAVRQSTVLLFKSFSEEQLGKIGMASDNPISVRAIGFIIIGHQKHHLRIIEERYL
jgi:hypothetical protein